MKKSIYSCLFIFLLLVGLSPAEAQVREMVMCTGVDQNSAPLDNTTTFGTNQKIFCSVIVANLRPGTKVTAYWVKSPGSRMSEEVGKAQVTSSVTGDYYVQFSHEPPWTPGDYSIAVEVDGLNPEGELPQAYFTVR